MYQKLLIKAEIEVLTGLHIGGSSAYSAIGAVNLPVIKDVKTQSPIIPGSSLKGKLRTLMLRNLSGEFINKEPNEDPKEILRLFGNSPKQKLQDENPTDDKIYNARLQFCDCFIRNSEELKEVGTTEVKFENTISRLTASAVPRQIERVIRGAKFDFNLIYNVPFENECRKSLKDEIEEDFKNLSDGLKLLQMDYLGGNGTRGYGKIVFKNFKVTAINSDKNGSLVNIKELEKNLMEVETSDNFRSELG